MFNLLKNVIVAEDEKLAKRVIDSNKRMEEIMREKSGANFVRGLRTTAIDVNDGGKDGELTYNGEEMDGFYNETEGYDELDEAGSGFPSDEELSMLAMDNEIAPDNEEVMADIENMLNEARLEAEAILNDARAKAEEEANSIKEQAYEEAYNNGLSKANEEMTDLENELRSKYDALEASLSEEYNNKFDEIEPYLVDTLIDVVEDVMKVSISDYKDIVLEKIKNAILHMENPKELKIVVAPGNVENVRQNIDMITDLLGEGVNIEVLRNEGMQESDCKIETEYGIFDVSFDVEWNNLKKKIILLSNNP